MRTSYGYIPKNLRAAEINLTELAMCRLRTSLRHYEDEKLGEEMASLAMGSASPYQIAGLKMVGPPDAPFPLTTSTNPPFVGPRTWIRYTGKRLNGPILHISKLLTK